jgi:hypothetical protein
VPDQQVVRLGFGQLEAEGAEHEAEFFVGEQAIFVGIEEVKLGKKDMLAHFTCREGVRSRSRETYGLVDPCFLFVGEFIKVLPCRNGVLYCAAAGSHCVYGSVGTSAQGAEVSGDAMRLKGRWPK